MALVLIRHLLLSSLTWLVISLPDSKTVEVEQMGDVTLSCTNVSDSPTLTLWMRGDNTSKPIMISSVYGAVSSTVRYMDGFKQGRHVLEYNLFFINLTILQVEVSDSGWYFCLFYHETKLVMVNSTFLKINGDDTSHKEDDTNSKSAGNWIMVGGMGAVNVFLVLVILGLILKITHKSQLQRGPRWHNLFSVEFPSEEEQKRSAKIQKQPRS
ncbi:hypothetical protein N1851_001455 [Merluccius polli]|uniref:Ig-like domain-containing protein n=1 Tax=Merluccius polli TaxID=89951 RepID=A0AA47PCW6_MERPO|nr:hypothetical protein N1851_001455 [Merluccius polli]